MDDFIFNVNNISDKLPVGVPMKFKSIRVNYMFLLELTKVNYIFHIIDSSYFCIRYHKYYYQLRLYFLYIIKKQTEYKLPTNFFCVLFLNILLVKISFCPMSFIW